MKKTFNSLPIDYYPMIYAFLNLVDLNKLKNTSSFFRKHIQHFLDSTESHKDTAEVTDAFMFLFYLLNLQADFPTLHGPQPFALPYLPDKLSSTPPRFSFFHRLLNLISVYPIESENFPSIGPRGNIDVLRKYTSEILLILENHYPLVPIEEQLIVLSNRLYKYKRKLLNILKKNEIIAYRSIYHQNIETRKKVLYATLSVVLWFFSQGLFSKNENTVATINALALLCFIFKLLDILFVSTPKNHLKKWYPGLILSNKFLKRKIQLFEHFFENSNSAEEVFKKLSEKIHKTGLSLKKIRPAENEESLIKSSNLFFYYQYNYHPHAFKNLATEKKFQAASIQSINEFYAHFYKKNQLEKEKHNRLN
jgi:hypothetical protein